MRKYRIFVSFACILILGLAGYAYASDIPGQVSVIAPGPHLNDVVIPGSVDPDVEFLISFETQHSMTLLAMNYLDVHLWSNEVAKTDPYDPANHYFARFHDPTPWVWGTLEPDGYFNTEVQTLPSDLGDRTEFTFLIGLCLDPSAYNGLWNWEIIFEDKALFTGNPENMNDTVTGTLDVTALISLSLAESSYDFGNVEQGVALVPIQSGAGYLTFTVSSNVAWLIQISGTNPDDGASHSFTVDHILQNSVDNDLTAVVLTNALAGLAGFGAQPRGSGGNSVYLWISVPEGQFIAVYTMMLTIVVVPA